MKNLFLILMLGLLTLSGCSVREHKVVINEIDTELLLNAHNRIRYSQEDALPMLQIDQELQNGAQEWAEHMARRNTLRHDRLDHSSFGYLAENIAKGQRTVEKVMDAWMNSRGHRRNILSGRYTHVGFGIARQENGAIFWCVKFGG